VPLLQYKNGAYIMKKNLKDGLYRLLPGAAIGIAVIIPGVSGGTMAVLFGMYGAIIMAASGLRKSFKKNFLFLLPIIIGAILGLIAMYFPIKFGLEYVPLVIVMLFAGLMAGGMPPVIKQTISFGVSAKAVIAAVITFAIVIGICFIPGMGDVNLGADMPIYTYFMIILMGVLASVALVVPGISGSMLMLIFGYYKPIINTVSALKTDFGHSLLVLGLFAVGVVLGLITAVKVIKFLMRKYPQVTNWAIMGFMIGSLPALFIAQDYAGFNVQFMSLTTQIWVGCILFAIGVAITILVTRVAAKKSDKALMEENDVLPENVQDKSSSDSSAEKNE